MVSAPACGPATAVQPRSISATPGSGGLGRTGFDTPVSTMTNHPPTEPLQTITPTRGFRSPGPLSTTVMVAPDVTLSTKAASADGAAETIATATMAVVTMKRFRTEYF